MAEKKIPNEYKRIDDATITKYLSDPKYRIQLHNMVHEETELVYTLVKNLKVDTGGEHLIKTASEYINDFELASANLRKILAYGCYFGTEEYNYLWAGVYHRLSDIQPRSGLTYLIDLQYYPLLLAMYAGGLSSLSAKNSTALGTVLNTKIQSYDYDGQVSLTVRANSVMLGSQANEVLGLENRKTPLSDHLYELFSTTTPPPLMFGSSFEDLFDEWEILVGMVYADSFAEQNFERDWAPVGRFSWRSGRRTFNALKKIEAEVNDNPDWVGFKANLFGGKQVRALNALGTVERIAGQVGWF